MRSRRYWRRRLVRHAMLGGATALMVAIVIVLLGDDGIPVFRLSMGTAYASLAMLAWGLLIGPWNVVRRRPNPVSTDLRRDVGIWAAASGICHMVFGLQVHLPGRMIEYFLWARGDDRFLPARYDLAGITNWSGLAAAVLLTALLAISNDAALRRLGPRRWKSLQRWNYAAFALIAVHGVIYQLLERRSPPWIVVFGALLATVLTIQVAGFRAIRAGRPALNSVEASPR